MANVFTGSQPDITPVQIVSGIPLIANALSVFGVYNLTAEQTDSLEKLGIWAIALIFGDAAIRIGRNVGSSNTTDPVLTDDEILDAPEN